MTLNELIAIASKNYNDDTLEMQFDSLTQKPVNDNRGDYLGWFIVNELCETFNPDLDDKTQLVTAQKVLSAVVREMNTVIDALDK